MAVGDNFNDLEMLEFAGLPVVMANSVAGADGARLGDDRRQRERGACRKPIQGSSRFFPRFSAGRRPALRLDTI